MTPTIRTHAMRVVQAWVQFKREPETGLPYVAEAINRLRKFMDDEAQAEADKKQQTIKFK